MVLQLRSKLLYKRLQAPLLCLALGPEGAFGPRNEFRSRVASDVSTKTLLALSFSTGLWLDVVR